VSRKSFKDRIGNGMIPAQRYRMLSPLQQFANRPLNLHKIIGNFLPRIAQPQIAHVGKSTRSAHI